MRKFTLWFATVFTFIVCTFVGTSAVSHASEIEPINVPGIQSHFRMIFVPSTDFRHSLIRKPRVLSIAKAAVHPTSDQPQIAEFGFLTWKYNSTAFPPSYSKARFSDGRLRSYYPVWIVRTSNIRRIALGGQGGILVGQNYTFIDAFNGQVLYALDSVNF